ncbi:MAG: hypothetical protein NVSMB69_02470 [Novosphingobium sp.]
MRHLCLALIATLPTRARLGHRLRTRYAGFVAAVPAALGLGLLLRLDLSLGLGLHLRLNLLLTLELRLRCGLLLCLAAIPPATTAFTTAVVATILVGALLRVGHRWQCHGNGGERQKGSRLQKSCAGHRRSPFVGAARGGSVDHGLGESR